ncbi:polyphosphate kinase 1 [Acidobacteriota bacterium]
MRKHHSKELSWLSFDNRVLDEAADQSVPLVERIKFLGIFSNNMDEFFRVRVATVNRLIEFGKGAKKLIGQDPPKVLKEIQNTVLQLHKRFDAIYQDILSELAAEGIFIIDETQVSEKQGEFIKAYFHREVRPKLIPIMIDQVEKFPDLKDESIYLLVNMGKNKPESKQVNALIEVPTESLSRFLILPSEKSIKGVTRGKRQRFIMLLDDVIRYNLADIFSILNYDQFNAFTIKITRDAELDIDSDLSQSYINKIAKGLQLRKGGEPVRFIYDAALPKEIFDLLIKKLKVDENDTQIPGGKYHNFKDFMGFPDLGLKKYNYESLPPLPHRNINPKMNLFKQISKKDILLHYPYQSFHQVIDFLREASIDPSVRSIKITLYRVAKKSAVINALINAVKNGKKVTVVMELQARFDEEANIKWSHLLQEEGVKVIHGVPGLKVHAKLCLITCMKKEKTAKYAIIGTGNFNEDTARVYSDHSLFTANRKLTNEVSKIFDFFDNNYKLSNFNNLIVSPFHMRKKLIKFIKNEIKNAQLGEKAYIHLKLNNLVDPEIIELLYTASQAGVEIKLNIRGMYTLRAGVEGLSENIQAISIVDRFLEHTRVFFFCNGGNEKVYLTSADIMQRNIDRRVEVTAPVYDKEICKELRDFFDIQWQDTVKARFRDKDLNQVPREVLGSKNIRAQYALYDYFKSQLPY